MDPRDASASKKWFLRLLIRGMFVFRGGLRFSFGALEVPEPRVRKRSFSLAKMNFSSLSVRLLPVPETKIEDHFSIKTYPNLVGNMASETTFDHRKVVFS